MQVSQKHLENTITPHFAKKKKKDWTYQFLLSKEREIPLLSNGFLHQAARE